MFRGTVCESPPFRVHQNRISILLFPATPLPNTKWIFRLENFHVLRVGLHAPHPKVWDYSIASSVAVGIAYAYPYAQVIYLRWSPGYVVSPAAGLVLVTLAAGLSLVSLLTMGRLFGVRPALIGLVRRGPYKFFRHP